MVMTTIPFMFSGILSSYLTVSHGDDYHSVHVDSIQSSYLTISHGDDYHSVHVDSILSSYLTTIPFMLTVFCLVT